jgi:hypothetical protein
MFPFKFFTKLFGQFFNAESSHVCGDVGSLCLCSVIVITQ